LDIRDIDVRIKIAVIYNDFQSRFPNLYGNINSFEIYTNDKGEEVYFMKFFYNRRGRRYFMFKTESGTEEGEVTIIKTLPEEIKIDLFWKTKKENLKVVEKYYQRFRNMEENPLTYPEKQDEIILIKMINFFGKSYGRYFTNSAERWREIDEKKKEENKARMEKEAMARQDTE
jgi:hypothetical protein